MVGGNDKINQDIWLASPCARLHMTFQKLEKQTHQDNNNSKTFLIFGLTHL